MLLAQKLNICATKFSIYDIGTHEPAHMEIMVAFGYPNGEIIRVTQSLKFCYAGCYARLFFVNKKRRKCYTETRYNASYKVVR